MQHIIGGQSDVGKLRRVAVKHARDAFGDAAAVDRQWRDLRYLARPDVTAAWAEYEHFLALLEAAGVDPLRLPPDDTVGLDSLYARDVSIVCDQGVILCNMGKPQRRTEPAAQEAAFRAAGRSEEHTSELQSQSNLVCRLLLEKKKEPQRHQLPGPRARRTGGQAAAAGLAHRRPHAAMARDNLFGVAHNY